MTGGNYRLPTEAEWEYAARSGSRSRGHKYSGSDNLGGVGWYDDNSGSKTHPVGQKTANELGLYDMSGNVYEWCSDWYGDYSSSPARNPKALVGALAACTAGAAGTTTPGSAGSRAGTAAAQTFAATFWASAWLPPERGVGGRGVRC